MCSHHWLSSIALQCSRRWWSVSRVLTVHSVIKSFICLNVVKWNSCIHPLQTNLELQFEVLGNFLYILDNHDIRAKVLLLMNKQKMMFHKPQLDGKFWSRLETGWWFWFQIFLRVNSHSLAVLLITDIVTVLRKKIRSYLYIHRGWCRNIIFKYTHF